MSATGQCPKLWARMCTTIIFMWFISRWWKSRSFGRSDARMKPSGEPLRRSSHRSAAVRNGSPSRCLTRTVIQCWTQEEKRFWGHPTVCCRMTFFISCELPDIPIWSVESVAVPRNIWLWPSSRCRQNSSGWKLWPDRWHRQNRIWRMPKLPQQNRKRNWNLCKRKPRRQRPLRWQCRTLKQWAKKPHSETISRWLRMNATRSNTMRSMVLLPMLTTSDWKKNWLPQKRRFPSGSSGMKR